MIVLETYCGLCNRLRAIQATLDLAQKYGHGVLVIWDNNENCGCRFTDLFAATNRFRILTTAHKDIVSKLRREVWRRRARACGSYLVQEQMDAEKLWDERLEQKYARQLQDPKACVYISTWDNYYHTDNPAYGWLHLRPELETEIAVYRQQLGRRAVGLHIRRTDHADAIRESPTELFEEAMTAEIAQNPDVRFYVATDAAAERERLKTLFPGRIVEKKAENLRRETVEGMKDTVLDIWCLAACKTIYGSFRSSFSEEAARLGHAQLRVLRR